MTLLYLRCCRVEAMTIRLLVADSYLLVFALLHNFTNNLNARKGVWGCQDGRAKEGQLY